LAGIPEKGMSLASRRVGLQFNYTDRLTVYRSILAEGKAAKQRKIAIHLLQAGIAVNQVLLSTRYCCQPGIAVNQVLLSTLLFLRQGYRWRKSNNCNSQQILRFSRRLTTLQG